MQNDADWLIEQVDKLTDDKYALTPSEWAEQKRYLPASVTPMPGFYRYDVNPALKEIVDTMDVNSPVREVSLMKGAQIGATVGILENTIGYCIDQVKTAPVMMLTADAEIAQMRLESYITPMMQQSELMHLVKSSDEHNTRKTGKTDKKVEWYGGGFLLPFGAKNASKLRSFSIRYLLQDECDGYPDVVGKDGDPSKLAEARTKAYHQVRKVLRLSTPLIEGTSRIKRAFEDGDQRYFNVPCKSCGEFQVLRFSGVNKETGEKWGLVWNMEDGRLVKGSTRYICRHCGHAHTNADKTWMFPRGKWVPTKTPKSPDIRSYHLSALYAPPSMYTWEAIVLSYLDAWDINTNKPKDMGLLQEFYNNDLGETFRILGDRLKLSQISMHRRSYPMGTIPNEIATKHCESKILFVNCAVDVHKEWLAVATFGWTKGGRVFLIDYFRWEGNCLNLDDPDTWGKLDDLVQNKVYIANDKTQYRISGTLVDSGYSTDLVYQYCGKYSSGVYPIKGREQSAKSSAIKEFSAFSTPLGTNAYLITVDLYKDRLSSTLRRTWDEQGNQPVGHFNAPVDISNNQLNELTVEYRTEKRERTTNKLVGYEWKRPNNARNELWDLLVYAHAQLDMTAWDLSINRFELEQVNWAALWDYMEKEKPFYVDP